MTPTVHVLFNGRVLCGQIHGLPKDWGPGHRWTRVEMREEATCSTCRSMADRVDREMREAPRYPTMLPPDEPVEDELE